MPTTDGATRVVARLAWRQVARGALLWGAVFALTIGSSIYAYESTYGTPAERAQLLRGFASNAGVRAVFGPARAIDTVGGFLAWRTLGLLPLVAGVWGLLAATRLLRGEEESGRYGTLLAGPVSRTRAALAMLAGIAGGCLVLLAITALSLLALAAAPGRISAPDALWLALALCAAAPAFAAVGALAAQLAATRREASALAALVFAAAFVLRVVADGSSAGWLRWATPLGWIEEMRPLTGGRPLALVPLVAWTAVLVAAAVAIASRRDDGDALLAHGDERAPRRVLLSSSLAFSARSALGGLAGWALGLGLAALLFGALSDSVARIARDSAGLRAHVEATLRARIDLGSAHGYLAVVFVLLAVPLSLYAATHATAAREEEATGRLDTVLAAPLDRRRWLADRLLVGAACCVLVAGCAALAAWAGALATGGRVGLVGMLQAAVNTLPVVALFLGVGALALAYVPRHTGAATFGAVAIAYLWEQTGALVKAPGWVLAVSPFHWVALVPSQPADVGAALVMLGIGAAAAALALVRFRRRDLVPA